MITSGTTMSRVTMLRTRYWKNLGSGFLNRDNSINIYLDGLPVNGKLQIRDWDDHYPARQGEQQNLGLRSMPSTMVPMQTMGGGDGPSTGGGEDTPF